MTVHAGMAHQHLFHAAGKFCEKQLTACMPAPFCFQKSTDSNRHPKVNKSARTTNNAVNNETWIAQQMPCDIKQTLLDFV